jgi:hypothetical protein
MLSGRRLLVTMLIIFRNATIDFMQPIAPPIALHKYILNLRRRLVALPIPDGRFIDTDSCRRLLLEQSQIKSSLLDMVAEGIEFFGIFRRLGGLTLSAPSNETAMNPCVCGFLTDSQKECTWMPLQIQRYRSRVLDPLLDGIDIQIEVPGLRYQELDIKTLMKVWP